MVKLTRRPVSLLDACSLRAALQVGEPACTYVAIAALGHSVTAPGLPPRGRDQTWEEYGRDVLAFLSLHGVTDDEARMWAGSAVEALPEPGITEAQVDEARSFFGLHRGSQSGSPSPTDGRGTPSEG